MSGPVGTTPLYDKLRLQPGQRALVINAPESFYTALGNSLDGITVLSEPEGELDFAILFASDSAELTAAAPEIIAHLVEDGLLWVAYPKRSSGVETDLSRDLFWEILRSHGYRAVTQVYIDPVWTAMRFRHVDFIGS
ncbi:MAG: hypothetical protein PVF83_02550 [Anaerolineales bacterium]|jgi:hypothetical protein